MILLIEKYSFFLSNNQALPLSLQFIKTSNYSSSPLLSPPISLLSSLPISPPLSHLSLSPSPLLSPPISLPSLISPYLSSPLLSPPISLPSLISPYLSSPLLSPPSLFSFYLHSSLPSSKQRVPVFRGISDASAGASRVHCTPINTLASVLRTPRYVSLCASLCPPPCPPPRLRGGWWEEES